jgi:hypothetical protein
MATSTHKQLPRFGTGNSELAAQLEEALVKNKELSEEVSRLQQIVLSGELGIKALQLQSLQVLHCSAYSL